MSIATGPWLPQHDPEVALLVPPHVYNIMPTPRTTGSKGGGVATIYRNSLDIICSKNVYNFDTMEFQELEWKLLDKKIYIVLIYRPPNGRIIDFIHNLTSYLELNIYCTVKTLYMGDFNMTLEILML